MCGIAGVYEYQRNSPVSAQLLSQMTGVIQHRGPDDSGRFVSGPVGLAMRRLSIIDVAGGKQPISNEDGNVTLVFNGEIYNYRNLHEQLARRGHVFETVSDTEVIVHLYEEEGVDCVRWLRGMFGFALWDDEQKQLLLARDRLGIKPLYYADVNGRLIFGSEIKSILQHPSINVELDPEALSNFISLKYVPAPQTLFRGIYAIPPGFILICNRSGINLQRYWDLSFSFQTSAKEAECAEQLEELLDDSVRLHLQSDVPFGAFLSGGLDSSTVVAFMAKHLNRAVDTFSVGFDGEGAEISEAAYAQMVADKFGTRHHSVTVGAADFLSHAEKVVWHLDQPVGDLACFANMMLAESAAHYVKMVLTGEGGDELFAGYARHVGERFRPLASAFPSWMARRFVKASSRVHGLRRPKLALRALSDNEESSRFVHWFPLFATDEKRRLLSDSLLGATSSCTCAERVFADHLMRADSHETLHRMLYVDTKLWLPDDLLARGDKMSMAASIEARVPLLDHKLVEFAASLPASMKLHGLTRKYLLRKVAAKYLPDTIIHRKKQGFPIPISTWFRKEAKTFVHDLLSSETVRRRNLFDAEYVAQILAEHQTGRADRGAQLWGLVQVELWCRQFLDSSPRRKVSDSPSVAAIR